MARLPLPREYVLASLKYADNRLAELPVCRITTHGTVKKITVRNPRHEYSINTENGKSFLPIVTEREHLFSMKKKLLELVHINHIKPVDFLEVNKNQGQSGRDFWKQLTESSNSYPKTDKIFHNGIHLRSRTEMAISEVLDELGLEYVYEPDMYLDGKRISPDFVIWLPAFECCIILEYFGMLDENNYLDNAKLKLGMYFRNGFFPGSNLIIICGDKNTAPSFDSIYNSIVMTIANLCSVYVKTENQNER